MRSITISSVFVLIVFVTYTGFSAPEQTWTGTISDSMCGASHMKRAAAEHLSDRECVIECIKALADYVLVDKNNNVIRIANQDFPGLPFRAGRAVKIIGEIKNDSIVISTIEAGE